MARAKWCEACQDHYEVHHFDEDGNHLVGAEYGWVGAMDARMRDLTAEVERLRAEVAGHLLRSDSLRAKLARQQDENERLNAENADLRHLRGSEMHYGSMQAEVERLRAEAEEREATLTKWIKADEGHVRELIDLRAEVESLRNQFTDVVTENKWLLRDRERLRAAVQAVRDLHRKSFPDPENRTGCTACAWTWPCSTIRALDAALGGERDE